MTEMALPYTAVTVLHADARQMGVLIALQTLPFALFSLPSGVWLEQIRKLPLIRFCHVMLIAVVGSVPLAHWLGHLTMLHLYVVGFLLGICMVFLGTALQVLTTHVAGKDQIVEAQGLVSAAHSATRMAGPAAAGSLIQLFSAPFVLVGDSLAVLVGLLMLLKLKITEPKPVPSPKSFIDQIKEGLTFVFQDPHLRTLTWSVAIWQLLYHGVLTLQVLLATRDLTLTGAQLGIGFACGGFTAVLGSLSAPRLSVRYGVGKVMMTGFVLTACGWLVLACSVHGTTPAAKFVLFSSAQVVFQLGVALFFVTYLAMRQALTPIALLSRVTATMRFLTVAVTPLGAIVAGLLGGWLGVQNTIMLIAVVAFVLVAYVARLTPLHQLESPAL